MVNAEVLAMSERRLVVGNGRREGQAEGACEDNQQSYKVQYSTGRVQSSVQRIQAPPEARLRRGERSADGKRAAAMAVIDHARLAGSTPGRHQGNCTSAMSCSCTTHRETQAPACSLPHREACLHSSVPLLLYKLQPPVAMLRALREPPVKRLPASAPR